MSARDGASPSGSTALACIAEAQSLRAQIQHLFAWTSYEVATGCPWDGPVPRPPLPDLRRRLHMMMIDGELEAPNDPEAALAYLTLATEIQGRHVAGLDPLSPHDPHFALILLKRVREYLEGACREDER